MDGIIVALAGILGADSDQGTVRALRGGAFSFTTGYVESHSQYARAAAVVGTGF